MAQEIIEKTRKRPKALETDLFFYGGIYLPEQCDLKQGGIFDRAYIRTCVGEELETKETISFVIKGKRKYVFSKSSHTNYEGSVINHFACVSGFKESYFK